jgi:glycerol-3-phosphate acyltransferase PlsY
MTEAFSMPTKGLLLLFPAAYLIGSIPFGVLVGKYKGIDVRKSGSRNIGATNVLRTAGRVPGLLTLAGDVLKGAMAVLLCRYVLNYIMPVDQPDLQLTDRELWEGAIGVTVVLGHMFSLFLSFSGGKGVATGFGVLVVYHPLSAITTAFIWLLVAATTRYSSLAAIIASGLLPLTLFLLSAHYIKVYYGIILALLIVLKHRENIRRIMDGTESRIGDSRG